MAEFTIEALEDLGDPDIMKLARDWQKALDGIEGQLETLSKLCADVIDAGKKVTKTCEARLKDKSISKDEKAALNALIDHAAAVRKAAARFDVL